VFVLYELEGFTLPEIAEALATPLGTATSRLRRARDNFEAWVAARPGDSHE
jgi:RNA polymerase sigma-70 factor (ECF subfamily)